MRRQAAELGLPTMTVDGSRDADTLADDLARRFRLRVVDPDQAAPTGRGAS